ncbi:MAG: ergothioneine biosynthesis protein EgtB [Ginsengibacter sp.]|jgi:ergothioneine biosynthesis protein EgtB
MDHPNQFQSIRNYTIKLCAPLETEDYVVQPIVDVSPPKWHLGHTTWFFETFILKQFVDGYTVFDPDYDYVFNSYYETVGTRVIRTDRGNLSRPTVKDVYAYRKHVDEAMIKFLQNPVLKEMEEVLMIGYNHEQQHQELLMTDVKYILGNNPLFPVYKNEPGDKEKAHFEPTGFLGMEEGIYEIGYAGDGFCFDNELSRHKVFLNDYEIASHLVSNREYLEFIKDGGYSNFNWWHADGWAWVKGNGIKSPMYWHLLEDTWQHFTLEGLKDVDPNEPVNHVSYYEAAAYASWKGMRLATEAEWEISAPKFDWGKRWEWTESAYLPYPGFKKAPGAIGEYNGKFMINQMVLRGASEVTSPGHSRITYRNFFQPELRWQYTGIRLAK